MKVKDSRGNQYHLSDIAGRGGQATVYHVPGRAEWLAKIYHRSDGDTENKLAWMVSNPPQDPSEKLNHASIAWPTRLLYAERKFAGYMMPFIGGAVPMLRVFNPRLRRMTFPNFNERYQINTAHNLAAALGALHARGYVVGDLNESNVLVTPTTLVTVIDTDSFQVQASNRRGQVKLYPCPVGKPEYLPPELQRKDLSGIVRLPEHDRFGLGVLIFQLLMNGSHPFRAKWTGKGEKPGIQERIEKGWYPYQDRLPKTIKPSLKIDDLHPSLELLFKRCFILGHRSPKARPAPEEWEHGLREADKALRPCGKGHYFSSHLSSCPTCGRLERLPAPPTPKVRPVSRPKPAAPTRKKVSRPPPPPTFRSQLSRTPAAKQTARLGRGIKKTVAWIQTHLYLKPAGRILVLGVLGVFFGGGLGNEYTGEILGGVFGALAGLVSGTLAGETIRKTLGWPAFWGAIGILVGVFLAGGLSGPVWSWGVSAAAFAILGWTMGKYGNQPGWTLLWTIAGSVGGWFVGQSVGSLPATSWAGGALSGGTMTVITASVYTLWRKYS